MSFSNHEQHSSLRSNELACPSARAVLGETGKKGRWVFLRVRCLPMAFPAAIRLERRRRHVPSRKAAPKKTTEFHAHPKDLHMARMSHQQLGQDQWLRCPSWVKLRNTQHEQMSSALLPRTDMGLARPRRLSPP